jgi:hypothetical protein
VDEFESEQACPGDVWRRVGKSAGEVFLRAPKRMPTRKNVEGDPQEALGSAYPSVVVVAGTVDTLEVAQFPCLKLLMRKHRWLLVCAPPR